MIEHNDQRIQIHAEIAAKLNFASHQSAFSLLRDLYVENLQDKRIEGLVLTLQSNPSFVKEKTWHIDRIAPQGSVAISDRDLELDGSFLLNLAESMRGTVIFQIKNCVFPNSVYHRVVK